MWTCVICGSHQQPECLLPNFRRIGTNFYRRLMPLAKTCSEVCRHEQGRRRKAELKRINFNEQQRKRAHASAGQTLGDKERHDDRDDDLPAT